MHHWPNTCWVGGRPCPSMRDLGAFANAYPLEKGTRDLEGSIPLCAQSRQETDGVGRGVKNVYRLGQYSCNPRGHRRKREAKKWLTGNGNLFSWRQQNYHCNPQGAERRCATHTRSQAARKPAPQQCTPSGPRLESQNRDCVVNRRANGGLPKFYQCCIRMYDRPATSIAIASTQSQIGRQPLSTRPVTPSTNH